jgi:predicted RNase H-like HicB family nuclease
MVNYIAVVHKDPNSDFGVSFPDFPGCVTAGSTIDDAKDMAHDALSLPKTLLPLTKTPLLFDISLSG